MMFDPRLEEVAGAILDGTAVDWNSIDGLVETADPQLIEQLKTLATLRRMTRSAYPSQTTEPGQWGHLRVFERIGKGAFGDVYRGWDTRLDREVALKLLPEESDQSQSPKSSIIEEGRLLARVRHPNVVTIHGAERIDGQIGLWMEFIQGRTLEEALRDGKAFTPKEVARIGRELCQAVSAVHKAGLLHRDIKAQNVMMADEGRLVLMDFGTGREVDAAEANVSGTPLYLAPEVLAGGAATVRSDVYSIGVVLYHLLTGSYPVKGKDLADLRRAHAVREQGELADGPAFPRRLRAVIGRAVDPDPGRRYAAADEFGAALVTAVRTPLSIRRAVSIAAAAAIVVLALVAWKGGMASGSLIKAATPPMITVVPFRNLSSEPSRENFVDGLTSEVIRVLTEIEGLQVTATESSFFFKRKPIDLRALRDQLGTDYIVAADVQTVGERLHMNVQLVPVASGVPLWSEPFDRKLDDVFAIQEEISRAIVNKLRLSLGGGQRRYQPKPDAYKLYLQAQAVMPGRTEGRGGAEARKLYEQATIIDPGYAQAYAGLALAGRTMTWNIYLPAQFDRLRPAALKAYELDPFLPEAIVARALTYAVDRDWEKASELFEQALKLNPNLTQIHATYSDVLILMGQKERGLRLLEQAIVLDPLSLFVRRDLAYAQFLNGRFEDAIVNERKVIADDPEFESDLMQARALTMLGRYEEAIRIFHSRPRNIAPDNRGWERWLARAYRMTGRTQELARLIARAPEERPYQQALVYAALEDKDRTFAALDKAVLEEPDKTGALLLCPEMRFLVGDPRLDQLRQGLRVPSPPR
jgi:TolB-like protein/tetratricopeptide (TPR) repeat protein/predicted Ser/Thr protein kinase